MGEERRGEARRGEEPFALFVYRVALVEMQTFCIVVVGGPLGGGSGGGGVAGGRDGWMERGWLGCGGGDGSVAVKCPETVQLCMHMYINPHTQTHTPSQDI